MESKKAIQIEELEVKIKELEKKLTDYTAEKKIQKNKVIANNNFLAYSPDSIFIGDPKGNIINCNYTAIRLSGYSRDELIGMNISKLFTIKSLKEKPLNYRDLNKGKILITERILKHKNGSEIPIEMNSNMLPDNSYITIIRDVRERIKFENRLLESEHQFYSMVENSFEGIILVNKEQKIIYCNNKFSELLGYSIDEIKGTNFEKYLTKESLEIVKSRFHARVKGENIKNRYIFKIIRKDKSELIVENSASVYMGADGKTYIIAQLKDITEKFYQEKQLQLSENRLKSMVENSLTGIGLIDDNYTFTFANKRLSEIFEYEIEEIEGANIKKFLPPESMDMVIERYRKRQNNEDVPSNYEFKILRKSGEKRDVEISSIVITDLKGNKQTLVQLQDITDKKTAFENIQISQEQYKSIFDGAYDGIIHLDKDLNILNVNTSFTQMSGLLPKDLIGKNPYYIAEQIVEPKDIPEILNIVKSSFIKEQIEPVEIQVAGKTIEFTAKKQKNNETIVVLRDITFRKEAEKAIHKSEAKYQQLFNSSPDPIIIHDGEKILDINPATLIATRIKDKSGLIGKKLSDLAHPVEAERTKKRLDELKYTKHALKSEEFTILLPNGEQKNVLATPAPIEIDGVQRYMVTYHDITELKEKEKEIEEANDYLKNVFDATSDGIVVYNAKSHKIINANTQVEILYGYSKQEMIDYKIPMITSAKDPMTQKEVNQLFKKTKKEGTQSFEWLAAHKDGHEFWADLSINYAKIGKQEFLIASIRDITDRKNATLVLKESQERFEQLASLSFEGIIIHENGKAIDVNHAFEKICGYNREEILSHNIIEMFVDPEYKALSYKYIKANYASPYEVVGIHKDGTRIAVELESRNVKIGSRKLRVTAIRDIREKKIEREKLEKSNAEILSRETTLRAIFDNSIAAIYVQNKDGIFLDVNKGAEEMYGYSKEELIGKSPLLVNAEGRNDLSKVNAAIQKAFNGQPQQFEFWGKRKSGEIFPKIVRLTKGKYFGEDVVFAFATDITEHKKGEEVQNILYDISKAGAKLSMMQFAEYIQKELGKIIDTTNFYIALYKEEDDTFSFPYYSDEKDKFTTTNAKNTLGKYVMETKKPLLADIKTKNKLIEKGILERQGSLSKVWMGAPLISNDEVIGVIAIQNYKSVRAYSKNDLNLFSFVSEQIGQLIQRKKKEDELKDALTKAKESDRLKSAFLANMSHEIRTPMNGILGFTSLLKDNIIGKDEQNEAFEIIEKSGNRLLNIINDLIDISKIEAGQIKLNISEYNIYKQLDELYNFFKLESQQNNLKFTLNVAKSLRTINIKSDENKIHAILTNLIKNAIKYTPQGEIEFGFELMSNHIKFYVKDTGLGIADDRQRAIFERFVQADIEDRDAMEGAGLGLAITKAYVEMLGGDIWLKSTINKGSTFFFSIPFDHTQSEMLLQQIENEAKKPKSLEVSNIDIINLLIAEDDNVSFYYLKTLLKFDNVRITRAENGFEAVSIMEMNPDIDLILMDIRMPRMGGLEATKLIRKFNTDVIIIAQTANAMTEDKKLALEAGCNDYISKPIFKDDFYKVIEDNLQRKLE